MERRQRNVAEVRDAAAASVLISGPQRTLPRSLALVAALRDPREGVRRGAARALLESPEHWAESDVARELGALVVAEGAPSETRRLASEVLAAIGRAGLLGDVRDDVALHLAVAMLDTSWPGRAAAAQALADVGPCRAVIAPLLLGADDADRDVARGALRALGRVEARDLGTAQLRDVLQALGNAAATWPRDLAATAARALGTAGGGDAPGSVHTRAEARRLLLAAMSRREPHVSAAATAALEKLPGAAAGTPPELLALVDVPDTAPGDVRRQRALKLAGLLGSLLAGGGLGAVAMIAAPARFKPEQNGPEVRRLAIRALQVAGCGDAAVCAALLRALRYDRAVAVRAAAAEALGALGAHGGPVVIATLCQSLGDEHVAVRAAAATALGELYSARADDAAGRAALPAADVAHGWVVAALMGLVRDPTAGMVPARAAAARTLGLLAGHVLLPSDEAEEARAALRLACGARDAEVRAAAVVALAAWAAHSSVEEEQTAVLSSLADSNGQVRLAAVDAVEACLPPSLDGSIALLTAALDRRYPQAALRARRLLETWCADQAGQARAGADAAMAPFDRRFGWACRRCRHDDEEGSAACAGCYDEHWPANFTPGAADLIRLR